MGSIQNDLDDNTYIGVQFPLDHNRDGFFRRTKTALEQASANIKNLLLTKKGERLGNPMFGSDLHRVLFEQEGDDVESKVEESIRSAMSEWLPFIVIKKIDIGFSATNRNAIKVSLSFAVNTDETNIDQLNFDLDTYQDVGSIG